jgi:hypothetical protein
VWTKKVIAAASSWMVLVENLRLCMRPTSVDLSLLKILNKRREILRSFATYYVNSPPSDPSSWLVIKDIGL